MYYKITYVHRGETKENPLFIAGDDDYSLVPTSKLTMTMGQSGELSIKVPWTNPARQDIICLTDEVIVYRCSTKGSRAAYAKDFVLNWSLLGSTDLSTPDDEEIWRGRPVTLQPDFDRTGTLICEGILSYLYDTYYPPFEFEGSPKEFLQMVLDNHNSQVEEIKRFEMGTVTVEDNNDYINRSSIYYNGRTLEVLTEKLINDSLGGFFRARVENGHRYLDYLKDYDSQAAQAIEYGVNLLDVAQEIEYAGVASVLLPVGAKLLDEEGQETDERLTIESVNGGSKYIVDEAAVERFGWIVCEAEWDDVTLPENLKEKGEVYLTQITSAVSSLEVRAVDLSLQDESEVPINLGDFVYIHSVPHEINQYIELTSMSIDFLEIENDTLDFGTSTASLTGSSRNTEADVKAAIGSLSQRLTSISAVYGDFTYLTAQVANIQSLLAGNIGTGELQAIHLTSDNVVIDDAVIYNALMEFATIGELLAGVIYTNEISIMSEDGGMQIIGNQMSFYNGQILFYDSDGNVRMQIGQDATGNFTFLLYAADGSGVMIDENGIKASAISDGLIVDSMVADNAAIQGSKLDIASVATCLNEDGTLVLDASRVKLDETGLDIYLAQLQNEIDSIDPADFEKYGIEKAVDWFCLSDNGTYMKAPNTAYAKDFMLNWSILGNTTAKEASADDPNLPMYDDRAYAENFTLGVSILGRTKSSSGWTLEQPQAGEGQYVWWVTEYLYYDGSITWSTPKCMTDSWARSQTSTLITKMEVVEGEIDGMIWKTDIIEDTLDDLGSTMITLQDQFTTFDVTLEGLTTRVGTVETTQTTLLDEYGNIIEEQISMSSQISTLTQTQDSIIADITTIYQDFATVDYTNTYLKLLYDSIEASITSLQAYTEGEITTISEQYANLNITVNGITTTVSDLEGTVQDNYEDTVKRISEVEQTASYISSTVSSVINDVTVISTTVEQGFNSVSSQIENISGDISSINQTILGIVTDVEITTTIANSAYDLASSVKQTAEGLESTVSSVQKELDTKATVTEVESQISQLANSITLSVTNGTLGKTASIKLSVNGASTTQSIDMEDVREAFADDHTSITISAGAITFNSGMLIVNSGQFTLDKNGNATFSGTLSAPSGNIGGWTIGTSSLYNGLSSLTSYTSGTYLGTDGLANSDGTYTLRMSSGALHTVYAGTEYGQFRATAWASNTARRGIEMGLQNLTNAAFISFSKFNGSIYEAAYVIDYNLNLFSGYRHVFYEGVYVDGNEYVAGTFSTDSITVNNLTVNTAASINTLTVSSSATLNTLTVNSTASVSGTLTVANNVGIYHRDASGSGRQFEWLGSDDFFYIGNQTSSGAYWTIRIRGNPTQIYGNNGSTRQLQIYNDGTSGDSGVEVQSYSGASLFFGVGSGGYNRGIYDLRSDRWVVYINQSGNTYLQGANVHLTPNGTIYLDTSAEVASGCRIHVYNDTTGGSVYLTANGSGDIISGISNGNYLFCGYTGTKCYLGGSSHWTSTVIGSAGNVDISPQGSIYLNSEVHIPDDVFVYVHGYKFIWNSGTSLGLGENNSSNTGGVTPLYIWGSTIYLNGSAYSGSDRSLKDDIQRLDRDDETEQELVESIDKLEPVSFEWKDNSEDVGTHYGYIADEVQAVFPDIVRVNEISGNLMLSYDDIIPLLHVKIKKQDEEITELKERIKALETAVAG